MAQLSVAHPEASIDDAYRVQEAFVEATLADAIGGFKAAGVSNPDGPLTGVVPKSGLIKAGEGLVLDLNKGAPRHVETEIGYRFGKAVNAPLNSVADLKIHVDAVMAMVEWPGGATAKDQPSTQGDIVAWNINAMELVVGPECNPNTDVDAVSISLTRDETEVNMAKGGMAHGGQWATLLETVNNIVSRGYTIEPGHVITNGALGKILPAEPGHYRADFGPLGVIEFEAR